MKRRGGLLAVAAVAVLAMATAAAADDADDLFARLDANGDGAIAAEEVPEAQRRLFQRLLRQGDKNGDGRLSHEEFRAALAAQETPEIGVPAERLAGDAPETRQLFARLDQNGDGRLEREELPERLRAFFERLDADGDGAVSRDEFERIAERLPAILAGRPAAGAEAGAVDRAAQAERLGTLFDRLDANGDGKLTLDETPAERAGIFERLLARAGGDSLTREQFIRLMSLQAGGAAPAAVPGARPGASMGPVAELFVQRLKEADADNDGRLSRDEAQGLIRRAFDQLDRNGDGFVDRDELAPLLERLQSSAAPERRPERP